MLERPYSLMRWLWKRGCPFGDARRERFGAKSPKPSDCGSVSGVPFQTARGDDVVGRRVEVGKVVMVVVVSVWKCMKGRGALGPKTQNQATAARSWVCRVKRRGEMMEWGAGVR